MATEADRMMVSNLVPLIQPAIAPRITPRTVAITRAVTTSSRVLGILEANTSVTGFRWEKEIPKSPWARFFT